MIRLSAAILLALAVVSAPALADKPDTPPGQSGGAGNGNGQGNGNDQGNGQGSGEGQGQGNGNGQTTDSPGNGNGQGGQAAGSEHGQSADGAGQGPAGGNGQGHAAAPGGSSDNAPHGADSSQGNSPGAPDAGQAGGSASEAPAGIFAQPPGTAGGQDATSASGHGQGAGKPADAGRPVDGAGTPAASGTSATPVVQDASESLAVTRGASGNVLAWSAPAAAAEVQVWRLDAAGWVPVAVVQGADGQVIDTGADAFAQYRLTWSSESLGETGLAVAATTLPLAPSLGPAQGTDLGAWLALLMWGSIGAIGLVRANTPRRVLESRAGPEHPIVPLLAGLPGIDVQALDRVSTLGVRTVGHLRAIDADALAFWGRLSPSTVRHWKETVELLAWPALPPGAGERLALAGHGTLAHVAGARAEDLLHRLRTQSGVEGPGVPADEQEVANWVVEARQALGLNGASALAPGASTSVPLVSP